MDTRALLTALETAGIRHLVVGGVAAALQGVPAATFDLDIVHARDAENCRRLAEVLHALDARYRQHRERVIEPRAEDLAGPGHHLLTTRHGPLDVLGSLIGGSDYLALEGKSPRHELAPGLSVRVLDLAELLRIKEALGREKDRAVLPLYRSTLAERARRLDPASGSR